MVTTCDFTQLSLGFVATLLTFAAVVWCTCTHIISNSIFVVFINFPRQSGKNISVIVPFSFYFSSVITEMGDIWAQHYHHLVYDPSQLHAVSGPATHFVMHNYT